MSKGSAPAGVTTATQTNPTQMMQAPFLQGGWNSALNLFNNFPLQYYPGQTLADFRAPNPFVGQGYNETYNAGQNINAMLPQYNAAYSSALAPQANPADPYYQQYAAGQSGPSQYYRSVADLATNAGNQYAPQVAQYANQAAANNNLGLSQLGQTASGYYLNANPYIDQMAAQAMAPITQNYQTTTAPGITGSFAGSGRTGSGAAQLAAAQGQQNYLNSLTNLSTNIYGQNYARERQAQDVAASQYGQLYNQGLQTGISGNQAAAGIYDQALRLGLSATQADQLAQQYGISGLNAANTTGNQQQIDALRLFPQVAAAQLLGPNATVQAGQGLSSIDQQYRSFEQAALEDQAKRFYGNQQAPYDTLSAYLKNIGQPQAGSGQTSTPYFQNEMANMLGAGLGATGILKNLGGVGGLGGLGGTGGLLGSQGALFGSLADASIAAGGPPLAAGLATTAGLEGLPLAAMAAPAAWIICTELKRQGKLPKRHWAAGLPVFAAYPEIATRGYYVWAIPSVRHLRRKPDSLYSRLLGTVFRWRAEDIAARSGVKGARKLWRGRSVTAALALPCLVLGVLAGEQDWQSIYRDEVRA